MENDQEKKGVGFGLGPLQRPAPPPSMRHLATHDPALARLAPCNDFRSVATDRSKNKGKNIKVAARKRSQIKGIVLHNTGSHYQRTSFGWHEHIETNFVIPASGIIDYNYDVLEERDGVVSIRKLGVGWVGVEFIGDFKKAHEFNRPPARQTHRDTPTRAQIFAGRRLIMWLKHNFNITHVIGHRHTDGGMKSHKNNHQTGARRSDDPGPGIWYNVGYWAIKKQGLIEGNPASNIPQVQNRTAKQRGKFEVPDCWEDPSNLIVDFELNG